MKKINLYTCSILTFLFVGLFLSSCKDEEPEIVLGCTDMAASNFDTNATEDNGTCNFLDLFVGAYSADFDCPSPIPYDSMGLNISSGGTFDQVFLSFTDIPLPALAVIRNKTTLEANSTINNIDLAALSTEFDPGTLWDVTISGTFIRDDDGVISGPLSFIFEETTGQVPAPIEANCPFVATPL